MIISATDEIEGGRIGSEIGRIQATSAWHADGFKVREFELRQLALQALVRRAEDVDADAIVGVEYDVDAGQPMTEGRIAMQRVRVRGLAVRLVMLAA